MTIRFLRFWNGNPEGSIATLSAVEESRLIGLGIATSNLNAIQSGPNFDSMADFNAAGGGSILGDGTYNIGGSLYTVKDENKIKISPPRVTPLRVATFGDSTANVSGAINESTGNDTTHVSSTTWNTGLSNYTMAANKYMLDKFYTQAFLVFNGGISGETTTQMLARDISGTAATKDKSISKLNNFYPDVVLLRGGSINDIVGVTSATRDSIVAATYANHVEIINRLLTTGAVVIDYGIFGAGAGMSATDIVQTKLALLQLNALFKAFAASTPGVYFNDPLNVTHDATGTYFPGKSVDGTHLSGVGQYLVDKSAANIVSAVFGESSGTRYRGANIVTNALMNTFTTSAPNVIATGYTITVSSATVTNKKIETIDNKIFHTGEITITAANPSVTITMPFDPSTMGINIGDIYGFEYDFYIESVSAGDLSFGNCFSRVDIRDNIGSGRVIIDSMTGLNNQASYVGETGITKLAGHNNFPPIVFGDVSANLLNTSTFSLNIVLNNLSGMFKAGVSMPRIVKLTGY